MCPAGMPAHRLGDGPNLAIEDLGQADLVGLARRSAPLAPRYARGGEARSFNRASLARPSVLFGPHTDSVGFGGRRFSPAREFKSLVCRHAGMPAQTTRARRGAFPGRVRGVRPPCLPTGTLARTPPACRHVRSRPIGSNYAVILETWRVCRYASTTMPVCRFSAGFQSHFSHIASHLALDNSCDVLACRFHGLRSEGTGKSIGR